MASPGAKVMERISKLPLVQKVIVLVGIAVAITAGNYFLFVQDARTEYESKVREMGSLEDTMIQNQHVADNLPEFQKQKEAMEQKLAQALTELPADADIEGLIDAINDMGVKAGLTINSIEPKGETKGSDGLYAEIPLSMTATGDYQEIALFFDAIRTNKRIIDISGIKLVNPRVKDDKLLVDASYMATSYRFIEQPKTGKDKDKDKAGKDKDKAK